MDGWSFMGDGGYLMNNDCGVIIAVWVCDFMMYAWLLVWNWSLYEDCGLLIGDCMMCAGLFVIIEWLLMMEYWWLVSNVGLLIIGVVWVMIGDRWLLIYDRWLMIDDLWWMVDECRWVMGDAWLMIDDLWFISYDWWLVMHTGWLGRDDWYFIINGWLLVTDYDVRWLMNACRWMIYDWRLTIDELIVDCRLIIVYCLRMRYGWCGVSGYWRFIADDWWLVVVAGWIMNCDCWYIIDDVCEWWTSYDKCDYCCLGMWRLMS